MKKIQRATHLKVLGDHIEEVIQMGPFAHVHLVRGTVEDDGEREVGVRDGLHGAVHQRLVEVQHQGRSVRKAGVFGWEADLSRQHGVCVGRQLGHEYVGVELL